MTSSPSTPLALLGAVLAGGRSRRYGEDKAAVSVAGTPMLERAITALAGAVDSVVVVSSRPVPTPPGAQVIPDRHDGIGPMGGLHAALLEASERGLDGAFVLACDLPLVTGDVVRAVVAEAAQGGRACAPTRGSGIEPLCSVWHTDVLDEVESRIASASLSLHGLFDAVDGRRVEAFETFDPSSAFLNVNTPDDRAVAEAHLADRSPR